MDMVLIMESNEKELKMHRTYLLRKFERYCKQHYIQVGLWESSEYDKRPRYFYTTEEGYLLIRDICIDLNVLTEEQIMEHENEMRKHYDKDSKK